MYIFGDPISDIINDVTPTFLTPGVLGTLRQADYKARTVLMKSGRCSRMDCVHICDMIKGNESLVEFQFLVSYATFS